MSPVSSSDRRQLLDVNQAAAYIARDVSFVRRLVARRQVAFYKPGRALRFDRADLDAYLDACKTEPWQ